MKETINHYFNIYPSKLYNIDDNACFYYDNQKYYFVKFERKLEELNLLIKVSNDLYNKGILVDTFVINKFNSFISQVNNVNYVLIKVNSIESYNNNIAEIIEFNNSLVIDKSLNTTWDYLWEKRVDSIEEEIKDFNKEYPIIRAYIDYYIGLAENAISYYKDTMMDIKPNNIKVNLNHKRVNYEALSGYLNNPLTFTFDFEVRDVAEYIKSSFFESSFNLENLKYIINFSEASLRLLFARLLYPNYFFDMIEEVLTTDKEESALYKYINRIEEYESFLMQVYKTICCNVSIPLVEWLEIV